MGAGIPACDPPQLGQIAFCPNAEGGRVRWPRGSTRKIGLQPLWEWKGFCVRHPDRTVVPQGIRRRPSWFDGRAILSDEVAAFRPAGCAWGANEQNGSADR